MQLSRLRGRFKSSFNLVAKIGTSMFAYSVHPRSSISDDANDWPMASDSISASEVAAVRDDYNQVLLLDGSIYPRWKLSLFAS